MLTVLVNCQRHGYGHIVYYDFVEIDLVRRQIRYVSSQLLIVVLQNIATVPFGLLDNEILLPWSRRMLRHVDSSPVDNSKRLEWYYGVATQILQQADKFVEEADVDRVGKACLYPTWVGC